ncbi:MAG: hypothetical protein NTV05_13240 [Acidobacteria bacterium]|nr:hypothetical protein [Acidobacteriota bacterium]
MMPRTRTAVTHGGLVAALVLSVSAGWPTAAAQAQTPAAVVASRPAPQATATAQPPGLSPIAVSRLAEGRPSEPQAAGTQVPLPTMNQPEPSPGRRGQGSQPPGLKPIAVSQLEEGRRSDSLEQMLGLSFAEPIAIRDLLQLLVRDTNISVVVDPDADGTFNGELKNVSLRQALELILQPINLEYSLNQGVLRVRKRQMQTRIFNINYVAARHIGYGLANSGFGYGNAGLNGLAGVNGPAVGGYAGYGMGLGVGYGGYLGGFGIGGGYGAYGGFGANGIGGSGVIGGLDTFAEMEKGLTMLLSPDGKLNLDRKAGLLQVTDYPDRLDRIANYVEVVETRNLRQVHIQAKVIEVEMNEQFSAGIDWSAVLRSAANSVTLTQPLAPTSSQSAFTMGVNIKDFKGLLSAFASQGRVNVMASPRVMAMNNEPAIMRVGTQDVFFVTTSQVESSTGQLLQTTVTPQTINEGITLSVMAQISEDGIIHLSISPTITERTGMATSRLGDQVPIVSVRETDTVVRVLQGETIVIAGLMQERTFGEKTKVPVLGDVPLVGGLFRRDDRTTKKVDLVILLTPTVVAPGGAGAMSAADQQRLYEEQRVPLRK